MANAERVSAEVARSEVDAGRGLLVCAYDSEAKCADVMVDKAISMSTLRERLPGLPRDQELLFYCA